MFHNTSTSKFPPGDNVASREDADLVRRFNAGDESAFATIMERYHARVLALVRRSLNNDHDAEDIAQDTFIRAHRGLANFRGDSALSTWLFRIALNLARNRYWYFFRRHRQDTISLNHPNSLSDLVAADSASPLRQTIHSEFVDLAGRCMEQLDPPHREILHLRYQLHHSYEEISTALNINAGTVKSRVARAREKLRKLILDTAPEFGRGAALEDFFEPIRESAVTPIPAA